MLEQFRQMFGYMICNWWWKVIGEACHYLDIMVYLAGSKIKSVCMNAMGKTHLKIQIFFILVKMENGSSGGNKLFF